jgi:hypothetical protein
MRRKRKMRVMEMERRKTGSAEEWRRGRGPSPIIEKERTKRRRIAILEERIVVEKRNAKRRHRAGWRS